MAWIETKGGDFWNPTKVNDAQGNPVPRTTPPTDQDFIEGWLIGMEVNQGKDKNSNLYSMIAPDGNWQKQVWGSHILNERMSMPIGSYVRIQWMGLQQPKVKGGRPYHDWKVAYDPSKGLHVSVTGGTVHALAGIETPATVNGATPVSKTDLPF